MLIMLIIPICMAAYGVAVHFNYFGPAYSLADFYRGDDWYHLEDDREASRRVAAWSNITLAVALTVWFFESGLI